MNELDPISSEYEYDYDYEYDEVEIPMSDDEEDLLNDVDVNAQPPALGSQGSAETPVLELIDVDEVRAFRLVLDWF